MPMLAADDALLLQLKEDWLRKMRGSLMVIAVLVASVTYQAGLNPPGGFWQEDMATTASDTAATHIRGEGHFAGDPVLRDKNFFRYAAFLACNTVAFVQSLCIIVLLMAESTFRGKMRLYLLRAFVVMHVTAMGMAYLVGYTRDTYDVYLLMLVSAVMVAFVAATSVAVHFHYKRKNRGRERSRSASHGVDGGDREDGTVMGFRSRGREGGC